MAALSLSWPATLPGPSKSVLKAAERRRVSSLTDGAQQAAVRQRDFSGEEEVEWEFTADKALIFDAFWRSDLTFGGARFVSTWQSAHFETYSVRRFKSVPKWTLIGHEYWRVTATLEVLGRSSPPLSGKAVFGLHFDGGVTDATTLDTEGGLFYMRYGATGGTTLTASEARYGASALRIASAEPVISGNYGNFQLGVADWQFQCWAKPFSAVVDRTILGVHALVGNGNVAGYGGNAYQLYIDLDSTTMELRVRYPTGGSGTPGDLVNPPALNKLLPTSVHTAFAFGTYRHVAVVQDNTSLRAYVDGTLIGQDTVNRVYVGTPFTNQGFVIGNRYDGVASSGAWPGFYGASFIGALDEMQLTRRVTFTGSSFTPPTAPF